MVVAKPGPLRLRLFIDYQNVYQGARHAFGYSQALPSVGQVNPRKVGRLIASLYQGDTGARLERVFVYRGMPDGRKDAKGYAACRRQVAAWHKEGDVTVQTRPLRYPPDGKPMEKGIDVKLAIDFVESALDQKAELLVIFSGDSDLIPALEMVYGRYEDLGVRPMSSAWVGAPRIQLPVRGFWCFNLTRTHFEAVRDDTVYVPTTKRRIQIA